MAQQPDRETSVDDYVLAIASARVPAAVVMAHPANAVAPTPARWDELAGALVAARRRAAARRLADRVQEARRAARFGLSETDDVR